MALETIPWGDWLGNLLTQMMLTVRQNLTNVIFYDTNLVDAAEIKKMQNLGQQRYKDIQFVPYDSLKTRVQGLNAQQAFSPVSLSRTSIAELLQLVPTVLTIMERVLQISAQESGAQATHQQSKEEVLQTGGASTNRVRYTGSFVDEGIDAWKQQRYDASMAYRDAAITGQVSADIPDAHRIIEELGFTVKHAGKEKLLVHGVKSGLKLTEFARSSEGSLLRPDKESAQIVFQVVGTIAAQPMLVQAVGARNLLTLIEFGARLGGAPRGWKLRVAGENQDQGIAPNIMQAIQAAQQATLQAVQEKIGQPAAEAVAKVQGQTEQHQAQLQQLQRIYDLAQKATDSTAIKARESATDITLQAQELAAKIQRDQAEFAAAEERKNAELASKLEREKAQSEAKVELQKKEAAAKAVTSPKPEK